MGKIKSYPRLRMHKLYQQNKGVFLWNHSSIQRYEGEDERGNLYRVVGPVRTGKSTFIKRFMDLLVLPNMTDIHAKERTQDELPQSASGTTIMTTEPKSFRKRRRG